MVLTRQIALGIGLLASAALLSGCPGSKDGEAGGTGVAAKPPATASADKSPATPADKPPTPPPPPPPLEDNPQPEGATWVYTPSLQHYIGEKLSVTYQLKAANGGKAWVALVPQSVTATDLSANETADVASSPTVDAAAAALNIEVPQVGRFRLRLFESKAADAPLLGESKVIVVSQWPLGSLEQKLPPYITINPSGPQTEFKRNQLVTASFELPPGYDQKGWVGVVPADTKSPLEFDNDGVQLAVMYLSGKTSDTFKWSATELGTFVFRVFPSSTPGCDYVAQSEPFTVVEAPKQ